MKMLTVLVVMLAAMALSTAAAGENASEYCKNHNDLGLSHGQCVSVMSVCNKNPDKPACICKSQLNSLGSEFYETYDNVGACIKFVKTGVNNE